MDEYPLIKTIKIHGRPIPYITDEIRQLMRTREHWRKIADRNFKREVKLEIRIEEREYVMKQIQNNTNNYCIWKSICSYPTNHRLRKATIEMKNCG